MNNEEFDKGVVKILIIGGIVFLIVTIIATIILKDFFWVFVGILLGGGAAALGIGWLSGNKDDALVSGDEQ